MRQEISALKKALLASAGRAESPVLPPPGPIPPATRATTSSSLVTPNTQKDLPSSPRLAASAAKAFWGGSASFGGVTPVHTTLIPENFAQPLASVKPLAGARAYGPILQENINPLLNANASGLYPNSFGNLSKAAPFDSYAEANPFTMKMLDAFVPSFFSQYLPPYCFIDIGCNSGLAWPNTNQHNLNSSHLPSLAWLLVCVPTISHPRVFLHLLHPLSLAESTPPSILHRPHHQCSALQLPLSLPRRNCPRHNRPYLQVWPHKHSFSGSVMLSGKPSLLTRHRVRQQMLVLRPGTRTRSDVSLRGRPL